MDCQTFTFGIIRSHFLPVRSLKGRRSNSRDIITVAWDNPRNSINPRMSVEHTGNLRISVDYQIITIAIGTIPGCLWNTLEIIRLSP